MWKQQKSQTYPCLPILVQLIYTIRYSSLLYNGKIFLVNRGVKWNYFHPGKHALRVKISTTWCNVSCFVAKFYLKICKGKTFKGDNIIIWYRKSQSKLLSEEKNALKEIGMLSCHTSFQTKLILVSDIKNIHCEYAKLWMLQDQWRKKTPQLKEVAKRKEDSLK